MAIYELYEVTERYILVKFDSPVKTSTLINDNFVLTRADASPVPIADPFLDINLSTDYLSIGRNLYLWYNFSLTEGEYTLTISNLETVFGEDLEVTNIEFIIEEDATPVSDELRPSREPIEVEDYSIKNISTIITTSSSSSGDDDDTQLEILSVYPSDIESHYIGAYDYQGKIEVTFNAIPAANFINSSDFMLQKKLINSPFAVWERVDTLVTGDSDSPVVNIYLPSTDATPFYSYETDDLTDSEFWEAGYKYKLTISQSVST